MRSFLGSITVKANKKGFFVFYNRRKAYQIKSLDEYREAGGIFSG
jgi:hypothetical protein